MMSKFKTKLSTWWQRRSASPEEQWLAQSSNIAELENRMRRLQTATDRLIFTQYGG